MHSRSAARRRHGVEFKAKALNWRATSLASSAFSFNALIQLSGTVPMPKRPEVVQLIDTLLETMTESQVATRLSELNHRNWLGEPFTLKKVMHVRIVYGLKSLSQRLRERGMLTADEVARQLDISTTTVHPIRAHGAAQAASVRQPSMPLRAARLCQTFQLTEPNAEAGKASVFERVGIVASDGGWMQADLASQSPC